MLTAEELLAGGALTFEVVLPAPVLRPGDPRAEAGRVRLRPLTVRDMQLVSRAAKESDTLLATLMVQRALVEPEMNVAQVSTLPVGLVQHLLHHVNRISGITASSEQISDASDAPLIRASALLAREYGWTPQQVGDLTLGQILVHLQLLRDKERA